MQLHFENEGRLSVNEPLVYLIRNPYEWQLCLPRCAIRLTW